MADNEEEIVVTLGDATTDNDAGGDDPAKVLAQQYKDLEADNAVQRQKREQAEQRERTARSEADRARQEVAASRVDVVESQYDTVATGLAAAQAEGTAAEQEYAAAFDKGDSLAMAKAQRKIANAEARAVRLDEAKAELEVRRKEQPGIISRRAEQQQRPTLSDDPVEAYVNGRTEPTKKWLRAHPEWVTDGKKNLKLTAAHNDALSEGLSTDTAEYFEHVENFIGLRQQSQNGNGRETPKRKTSVPAAPVHQSSGGTNGGPRSITLSRKQADAAKDGTIIWNYDDPSPQKKFKKGDPIGVQEMARRVEAQTKQGMFDRSYTEA